MVPQAGFHLLGPLPPNRRRYHPLNQLLLKFAHWPKALVEALKELVQLLRVLPRQEQPPGKDAVTCRVHRRSRLAFCRPRTRALASVPSIDFSPFVGIHLGQAPSTHRSLWTVAERVSAIHTVMVQIHPDPIS